MMVRGHGPHHRSATIGSIVGLTVTPTMPPPGVRHTIWTLFYRSLLENELNYYAGLPPDTVNLLDCIIRVSYMRHIIFHKYCHRII